MVKTKSFLARSPVLRRETLGLVFSALIFFCLVLTADLSRAQPRESAEEKEYIIQKISAGSAVKGQSGTRLQLFSPSVGQRFYEIADELANGSTVLISPSKDSKNTVRSPMDSLRRTLYGGAAEAEQATIFLNAAISLGSEDSHIRSLLLKLAGRHSRPDYAELVFYTLEDYVSESADLEVVRTAIRYLLEELNAREERELLLKRLLKSIGSKNSVIRSDLECLLGLLMAEKADFKSAQYYLLQAYSHNEYNKLAFAKLTELIPERIGPEIYLGNLKLILCENPLDIDAAIAFAQYTERLQLYETAAKAYEYCAFVFRYLYPSEPLPARIYLPWVVSYYNTEHEQHRCLQIASELRQEGRFDLLLEAIAGKAALKVGKAREAAEIFHDAENKAQQLFEQGPQHYEKKPGILESYSQQVRPTQFAWFYCFVLPDAQKALAWANKAYATEAETPATAALLAYSLVMNQQIEWARPLIDNYQPNQIADLTLAQIQLAQGQKTSAIKTLKSAIAKDPGSLAAEQAKELLARQGADYILPIDTDSILTVLEETFGETLVPAFTAPEEIISVQFNTLGHSFYYGSKIEGTVAITNNSSEPLVISNDGLFKGHIRIDADVRGDIRKKIPNLVSTRMRTALLVEPGGSIVSTLQLVTGELRDILLAHPQASLDIEFTLYIDPVITAEGKITNRLTQIKPVKAFVHRPGIELTGKYLRSRFASIAKGKPGQKIRTAQLFIGLLMEQQALANRKPMYRYLYADWMPTMLMSALIHESGLLRNPADDEWVVKVHTMADMLSLPLDQELTRAVADNLNNPKWPVRMMALYLLAKTPGNKFNGVLDWAAKYDSNQFVRDMAIALGAAEVKGP